MPRETRPCATCGEPVTFLPSQRGAQRPPKPTYAYSDTIYCSRKCKGIGHSKLMTGRRPSQGNYTSHHTFRTMIRREFHDRCAICGWDEAPCDVCHIVARKNGGSDTLDNVVMLCPNHHRLFDRGTIAPGEVHAARSTILR